MNRPDLFDISHHNGRDGITWADVPLRPIVHKVNEGSFIDPTVRARMATIAGRTEMFGGYTVVIVSKSTIREQIDRYVEVMSRWWRPGAFTQLDVEPWPGAYPRPVTADEVVEAHEYHVELVGRPPAVYINPREMPGVLEQIRAQLPDVALWEPHYGSSGHLSAVRNGAVLHQWTSAYQCPGIGGIDANTILQPDTLRRLAGLSLTTPEVPEMRTMAFIWRHEQYRDWFLVDGANVIRLSKKIVDGTDVEHGLPMVVDDDLVVLRSYLHHTGLTTQDLTPV